MDIKAARILLQHVYPNYRTDAYLIPDLTEIIMSYTLDSCIYDHYEYEHRLQTSRHKFYDTSKNAFCYLVDKNIRSEYINIIINEYNFVNIWHINGDNATHLYYNNQGVLQGKRNYVNGLRHGEYFEESCYSKYKHITCNYWHGKKRGSYIKQYHGKKWIEHTYNDYGCIIENKQYYGNGVLHIRRCDKYCGQWDVYVYYRDGTLQAKYRELYRHIHGEYKRWSIKGRLLIRCMYVNGKKRGLYESFYNRKKSMCYYLSASEMNTLIHYVDRTKLMHNWDLY